VTPKRARAVVTLTALAAVCGCATAPPPAGAPIVVRGLALAGFGMHEDCLHAEVGDRIDYVFDSSEPVRFGLRYREGGAAVFPVELADTRGHSGVLAVRLARDYCLTWEAGAPGAVLDYRIRRRAPGD
jgi:MYXO-CTERM domain-containing protein